MSREHWQNQLGPRELGLQTLFRSFLTNHDIVLEANPRLIERSAPLTVLNATNDELPLILDGQPIIGIALVQGAQETQFSANNARIHQIVYATVNGDLRFAMALPGGQVYWDKQLPHPANLLQRGILLEKSPQEWEELFEAKLFGKPVSPTGAFREIDDRSRLEEFVGNPPSGDSLAAID